MDFGRIWRWLDAVHDREPAEQQPPFDEFGDPVHEPLYKSYRPFGNRDHKEPLWSEQPEEKIVAMEPGGELWLGSGVLLVNGRVQILQREPTRSSRIFKGDGLRGRSRATPPSQNHRQRVPMARSNTLVPEANDRGHLASKRSPPIAQAEKWDPVGIDRAGKKVSQWAKRVRADSKSVAQKLFHHQR